MLISNSIGIFDSGIGGLSVLKHIHQLMPNENLHYVADHAYAPYGKRDPQHIRERCIDITQHLINQGAKAIVVACNTATAAAIETLREQFDTPIIGMEPGLKPAIAHTKSGTIAILATDNTLASEKFLALSQRHAGDKKILIYPCTDLVSMIEKGDPDSAEIAQRLADLVPGLKDDRVDTLVLGCSHYPLIIEQIRKAAPGFSVIDTGPAVARETQRRLETNSLSNEPRHKGAILLETTGKEQHHLDVLMYFCPQASKCTSVTLERVKSHPPDTITASF